MEKLTDTMMKIKISYYEYIFRMNNRFRTKYFWTLKILILTNNSKKIKGTKLNQEILWNQIFQEKKNDNERKKGTL